MSSSTLLKECICCDAIRLPGELESKPFLQQAENVLLGRIDKKSTLDMEQLLIFPEVIEKIGEQDPRGFEAEYRIHDELKNSKLHYNLFANIKRPNLKEKQINLDLDNALFQDDYMQKLCGMTMNRNEIITSDGEYSLRTLLAWFYGRYHKSCTKWSTLEENLEIQEELNREYKLKRGQKSKNRDIAGIFLTPVQRVILESDQPYLHIVGLPGTGKTYCLLMKMVDVYFDILQGYKQNNETINEIILVFHLNQETLRYIKNIFWQTVESLLSGKKIKKKEEVPNKDLIKFISHRIHIEVNHSFRDFIDIDTNKTFQTKDYDLSTKFKVFCDDVSSDVLNFDNVDTMNEMLVAIDRSSFCWCTSYCVKSIMKNFYRPLAVVKVQNNKMYDYSQYVYLKDSLRYTARIHALIDVVLNLNDGTELCHLGLPTFNKSDFSSGTRVLGQKKPMLIPTRNNDDMDKKAYELWQNLIKKEQLKENEIAVIECVRYESEGDILKTEFKRIPLRKNTVQRHIDEISPDIESFLCNYLQTTHFPMQLDDSTLPGIEALLLAYVRFVMDREIHEELLLAKPLKTDKKGLEVNYVIVCMTDVNGMIEHNFPRAYYFDPENPQRLSMDFFYSDEYRKFDLLEALSRAISSVTVFYIDDDPLLCKIESDLKNTVPSISQSDIYKKKVNLVEVLRNYEPLSMDSINQLNIVKAASEFHYFHFNYHSIRCPENSSRFLSGCCNFQCIDDLMKEVQYNVNPENPEENGLIFSTKINIKIKLTDPNVKKFLQDWKKKLETTTIEEANLLLTEENPMFSYLVRSLVFIIETAALPFIPEIAKCQFSHPESLSDNFSLDKSSSSSSWIYETFGSRRITNTDENGTIIDDVIFEKEDGEINYSCGQNYQILKQQLEVFSPFREMLSGCNINKLIRISRFPIYAIEFPNKPNGFGESVFSPIKKLNQILLGIKLYLVQRDRIATINSEQQPSSSKE
ncbi:hypothetical protein QYM36_010164 [Artemia franciscana]|uniref:Uncharacterized protein n=1 Tax=Artemia franciscana TaxID=6661 RepID=A0AA88L7I2_ARTSF|nr:hypothetical protein QYM36_010164 [Artemia franciscana]